MSSKTLARTGGTGLSLGSVFSDFLSPWNNWLSEPAWERALRMPAVNISENDKSYQLTVAAPGLKKEDFDVQVDGNMLTISSEKEESGADEGKGYTRCEYNYSSFSRSFTLPEEVKSDAIEAEYKNGELLLMLPKSDTAKKLTNKINVK